MRILAFDPASLRNLGWCFIETKEIKGVVEDLRCVAGTFVAPLVDETWKVLYPMSIAVKGLFNENKPDIVIVEKTSNFAGGFITGQVSNCLGMIYTVCGEFELKLEFVYPSRCKKLVTGNGRAKKGQIKKSVRTILEKFGIQREDSNYGSEHAFDATATALAWLIDKNKLEGFSL